MSGKLPATRLLSTSACKCNQNANRENKIECHTVPLVPGSRFSSRFSSRFDKLDKSYIIHGTKKHTMVFDISTAKMQICVTIAALRTIISSFNKPPGPERM